MTTTQTRQPEGIPTGGQFAATTHPEPDVALSGTSPAGFGFDDEDTNARFVTALGDVLARRKGRYIAENDEFELEYGTAVRVHRLPLGSEDYSWEVSRQDGAVKVTLHGETDPLAQKILDGAEQVRCATPEEAAELVAEAMDEVLDAGQSSHGGTPDGFASDADYRRWRER